MGILPANYSNISVTGYSSSTRLAGHEKKSVKPAALSTPPMPPDPYTKGDCSPSLVTPLYNKNDYKEIVITSEDTKVAFLVEKKALSDIPEETGKLIVIADLIRQLNSYVQGEPVSKVRILDTEEFRGEYLSADHEIVISKSVFCGEHYLHTIAHEMGHAVYCSMPKDAEFWQKLHIYSLGYGRYGLAADSNYAPTGGYYGHPFRNASELFASSFAAYVMHPDQLTGCINDPGLLESTGKMGKILYCFIRDSVVGGKVFGKEDPFKGLAAGALVSSITEEDIYSSIQSALHDKTCDTYNQSVAGKAAHELFRLAKNDDRYFRLLAASAIDRDPCARRAIIVEIGRSNVQDARLDQILISALHDKDVYIRLLAESALNYRKKKAL